MTSKRKESKGSFKGGKASKKAKTAAPAPDVNPRKARQTQRKHGEEVEEAKKIWNQLRLKTNTKEQTRELLDKLMPLIKGKSDKIALQHDGSRVIQAAIQFGTPKERQGIVTELCAVPGTLIEIAKSQYAHFCLLKVIKYCHNDEVSVKNVLRTLKGHMPKLAVHAVASRVIESLFATLPPKQTASLKLEFYGPHFSLFAADFKDKKVPTLKLCLQEKPDKREKVLQYMQDIVNKGVEKTLYGFTYFQEIMDEYCTEASPNEIRNLASSAADHVIHLLSSRPGTRVAANLIAYGTAKDRKRVMKSLKGYIRSGLMHHDAYLAIIRLVQLTDDTVSTQKNLINELLKKEKEDNEDSPLKELALSDTASKFLLALMIEDKEKRRKCFDPYELSVLFDDPKVIEDGQEVSTSKKDEIVRRTEVLKQLEEAIVELCTKHARELLQSIPGSVVLREAYACFKSKTIVDAVIEACDQEIFEDKTGHLALKHLFQIDSSASESPFSDAFFKNYKGRFDEVTSSNRGCFVVSALLKNEKLRSKVIKELDSGKLEKTAKKSKISSGFEALMSDIQSKS